MIYSVSQLKKGDIVKMKHDKAKKRLGKSISDYGILEYIEPYSENRNIGHFKTQSGDVISLNANEVEYYEPTK